MPGTVDGLGMTERHRAPILVRYHAISPHTLCWIPKP
jgi:hypothetical protein